MTTRNKPTQEQIEARSLKMLAASTRNKPQPTDSSWVRTHPAVSGANTGERFILGNDNARPYWKAGATGSERLEFEFNETRGEFQIICKNNIHGATQGGKEAWALMNREAALQLCSWLHKQLGV